MGRRRWGLAATQMMSIQRTVAAWILVYLVGTYQQTDKQTDRQTKPK
jgi:hypothetical protein